MKFQTVDLTNPDLDLDTDFIHKLCEVEPRLRIDRQEIFPQTPIRTSNDIIFYLADTLTQYPQERCYAVFLDAAMCPIGLTCVGAGFTDTCPVSCTKIAQTALLLNATGVILVHNHPSGHPAAPSKADIQMAKKLTQLLRMLDGMQLHDFIIVSRNPEKRVYSMLKDESLLDNPVKDTRKQEYQVA